MSNYEAFNELASTTLAFPRLAKADLHATFLQVEELIFYGVDLMVQATTFMENNLCYVLAEIAMGTIKSRKIYKGKRNKARKQLEGAVHVGVENFRVLSLGFDLFKVSRLPRNVAVPLTRRIIRSLQLSTYLYESILRSFVKETATYSAKAEKLTELTLHLKTVKDPMPPYEMAQVKVLKEELASIEERVGCSDPHKLYGIVRLVKTIVATLNKLQSHILKSYQRMVLHPSREKSLSENEALDLFQAGSLGLSHAISLYDTENASNFSSFAGWWIKQRIMGSAKLSGPLIRLPWSVWESHQLIRAAEHQLETDPTTRYTYTVEDVAKLLGKSVKSIQKVKDTFQTVKLASLDTPQRDAAGTETTQTLGSILPDPNQALDTTAADDIRALVKESLAYLPADEKRILCLRFGLIDELGIAREDTFPVAKELLRQCACKAQTYLFVTKSAKTNAVCKTKASKKVE